MPIFLEAIDSLLKLDQGTSLWKRKHVRHRVSEDMIDNGKLWWVAGGN